MVKDKAEVRKSITNMKVLPSTTIQTCVRVGDKAAFRLKNSPFIHLNGGSSLMQSRVPAQRALTKQHKVVR